MASPSLYHFGGLFSLSHTIERIETPYGLVVFGKLENNWKSVVTIKYGGMRHWSARKTKVAEDTHCRNDGRSWQETRRQWNQASYHLEDKDGVHKAWGPVLPRVPQGKRTQEKSSLQIRLISKGSITWEFVRNAQSRPCPRVYRNLGSSSLCSWFWYRIRSRWKITALRWDSSQCK